MAAKHKAATSVTIASTQQDTEFNTFVSRHWKTGLLVFLGIAAVILLLQQRREASHRNVLGGWAKLDAVVGPEDITVSAATAPVLGDLTEELRGEAAAPYAKAMQVVALVEAKDLAGARAALGELEAGWPDHPLVRLPWPDSKGGAATLPDQLRSRIQGMSDWKAAHPSLRENPALAENAPRVRLVTSAGEIVIGLYPDLAPMHVERFLAHCRAGDYDGTRFHRIAQGFLEGGDPNSRDLETPEKWGNGGTGEKTPLEPSALKHFPYAVSSVRIGQDQDSADALFAIALSAGQTHARDGGDTVFGMIVEGQAVVDAIGSAAVTDERPNDPVIIQKAEVL